MSDGGDPVVLIAEDERDLADLFASVLEANYDVRVAYDGQTALERYDETVEVVLLDRRMPNTTGDEVLERIRDQPGDCGVAMITAVDPSTDVADMAFDEYIVKPADHSELDDLVQRLLQRTECDDALREHYRLTNKLALLEDHLEPAELANSEGYHGMQEELAALDRRLDRAVEGLGAEDVGAILRSDSSS